MKKLLASVVVSGLMSAAAGQVARAQTPPPPTPLPTAPGAGVAAAADVPFQMQLTISRFQGEKRVSSLPYVLSMKALRVGGPGASGPVARVGLGARVPVQTQMAPVGDGKSPQPITTVNYENVGTNIEARALMLPDGRIELNVTINESSVVTDTPEPQRTSDRDRPVFRSYQSTNTIVLKDGETTQFTAASDRVSGEVVRVEVKVTVLK